MTSKTWTWAIACAATFALTACTDTSDKSTDDTDTDTDTMDTDTDTMDTDTDTMDSDTDGMDTDTDVEMFDLTFSGSGYTPHDGQTIYVSIRDDANAEVASDSAVVASGAFSFTWTDLLVEGETYNIDFYADRNGNSMCDTPDTDHAWRVAIAAVTADVTQAETHNTNFTDVCSSF